MPPKNKPQKKQQKEAVNARSADFETLSARENVPRDSSVNNQKFSSLPKKVREVVYGRLDMHTAHSASLACPEIHDYFTEHPFQVDKIQFKDAHARSMNITHKMNMNPATVLHGLQITEAEDIAVDKDAHARSMNITHKMNMNPATVLHGLQITEAEDIAVDLLTLLCCSPRGLTPIRHPPKQLLLYWEKRKKKVAEERNDPSHSLPKSATSVEDLTEGQILQGIQTWIDFIHPTEQVILQVEDRSISIPSGFFGLPGIKAAKGVITQVFNKNSLLDYEKAKRERPFVNVDVTLKQIRRLSATKILLGIASRISSKEVVQFLVEKVNDWLRGKTVYIHFCFTLSPDDVAYKEETILRELNLARLSPRFVVHSAKSLQMRSSPMTAAAYYGAGTIIQDMETPRAMFLGFGPRIFALNEGECEEIMWKVNSHNPKKPDAHTKRVLMPVPGWPTEFAEFRDLPKRALHSVCSHLDFADAQVLCAVYPKANEYYQEHPFVQRRVRFWRFEKHQRRAIAFSYYREDDSYSVQLHQQRQSEDTQDSFYGILLKHNLFFNQEILFGGVSRVKAQEIVVNFLSIRSASPSMKMAPHLNPPEILTLVFEALRTECVSCLHEIGQPIGMTNADLCKQPEMTVEGVRRWLHFIQPTVKLVLRQEIRSMKLPSAIFDLPEVRAVCGLVTELDNSEGGVIFDVQVDVTMAQVRALSATYIFLGYTPRITDAEVFSYIVDKAKAWIVDCDLSRKYNYCFARRTEDMRELVYANKVIAQLQLSDRFRVHQMSLVWPDGYSCYGFGGQIIQDKQNPHRALLVGCGPGPKIHTLTDEQLQEVNWSARAGGRRGAFSTQEAAAMNSCINQ